MKLLLTNEYVVWTARVFLGLTFVVAAIEKVADPSAFVISISNYDILPVWLLTTAATLIPWIELVTGLAIMFGVLDRGGAFLASILLSIFALAVLIALVRGLDISCGCFTQDPNAEKIGWYKVAENLGLILVSLFLFYSENTAFTLEEYYRRKHKES